VASVLGLDETLAEALALGHDIGHPPFGHAGEEELNRQMSRFGGRFDHNLHALRIVETFERRYARFPGLNLTFEVREGLVKHSRDFVPGESPELAEYLPGQRPPMEAQLIDPVDEIAYITADLDDAYSGRLFSIEEVTGAVPGFAEVWRTTRAEFPEARKEIQFFETLRRLAELLVTGLIEGTVAAVDESAVQDVQEVRQFPRRLARFEARADALKLALRHFLYARVYLSDSVQEACRTHASAVAELFQFLLDHPERARLLQPGICLEEPLHLFVCDYIAGMTDGFFCRTYESILGSFSDRRAVPDIDARPGACP
jgi:dGTPase